MQDTPDEIINMQREIYAGKSASERFLIGVELINFGRIIVESSIKQLNPDISPVDLKVEVFKRYYKNSFEKEEFENIIQSMIEYFKKKPDKLKFSISV